MYCNLVPTGIVLIKVELVFTAGSYQTELQFYDKFSFWDKTWKTFNLELISFSIKKRVISRSIQKNKH